MTVENETRRTSPGRRGPSRRTVVAGTAWTLPAVAVATAAPAFAASPGCPVTITEIGGITCRVVGAGDPYYKVGYKVVRDLACSRAFSQVALTVTSNPATVAINIYGSFTAGTATIYLPDGGNGYRFGTADVVQSLIVTYSVDGGTVSQPIVFPQDPADRC